ncbi:hypothetical protein [Mycetocola reblochoni]|uniref:hypothetical protein n=1 Tax=Mycetocola reblochoni TaxID=331618 RepID=UPI003F9A9AAC
MTETVVVAIVGGLATVMAAALTLVAQQLKQVRRAQRDTTYAITNGHPTHIRDDVDQLGHQVDQLGHQVSQIVADIGGMRSEHRRLARALDTLTTHLLRKDHP